MTGKRTHKESRRMHKLRREFFEEGKRQSRSTNPDEVEKSKCWICRDAIDYDAGQGTTSDSHELDHYHPVDDRPDLEEDVDNFRHSHSSCNSSRGKRAANTQGLGEQVAAWW
ncbi:HNH endonuclease [Microbacterium paraoxydans]|uniref:HNH domain-containing protein n=1 Tax=Microbacterium paraoxydans TaxID=199592 RepID=A0A1H1LCJ3_9MICO|nr:HNH endonuclease [Microbacterium paraoxydans]SDR72032.1 hypothetical protein SAMN04489809_0071 [Microbacterium paraoxydans]